MLAGPSEAGFSLTDQEFRLATRWRMGLDLTIAPACRHTTTGRAQAPPRPCRHALDPKGVHALTCKIGGCTNTVHNAVADVIHEACKAAGYSARREQVIPELATEAVKEPRLDVEAWGVAGHGRLLLDITVRNERAERYRGNHATSRAEREKSTKYPAKGGVQATGIAVSVQGRHGPQLAELLDGLADLARARELSRSMAPTKWLKKWRAQIAMELARFVGRAASSAAGG